MRELGLGELAGSRDLVSVAIVSVAIMGFLTILWGPPTAPTMDGETYARYALGLAEYGTFGKIRAITSMPAPEQGVSPLYPAFLALLIHADTGLRASLTCALGVVQNAPADCPERYWTVSFAQGALVIPFLIAVWLAGLAFTASRLGAWLAMAWSVPWSTGVFYSRGFLTEALSLPLLGLLTLFLLLAMRQPGRLSLPLLCGLCCGLLTLTKPSFAYLFWFLLICGMGIFAALRAKSARWFALLLFVLSYAAIVGPWIARNWAQFGNTSLTTGYGAHPLSHRIGYNRMSVAEWGTAFIYWLPDFGDDFAAQLFPPHTYEKLGWGPDSHYIYGADQIYNSTRRAAEGDDNHVKYLIVNEVLGNWVTHTLVSLPLAWRGMFVKGYGGLAAWVCCGWLLWWTAKQRQWSFWVLCLPAFFLVALHAGASVSIPRYNIALIPLLALAVAAVFVRLADRIGLLPWASSLIRLGKS